jgi:FMN phosphatase YigB (HAD superfamily)
MVDTGFAADEILFVGDSLVSDYLGSEAVGMKPVLIDRDHKNTDNNIVKVDDLTKILELL